MPPRTTKLAASAAADVDPSDTSAFPGWDALVEEAREQSRIVGRPDDPYILPLPVGGPVKIPPPDGDRYLSIVEAQRRGDTAGVLINLIPDKNDLIRVRSAMKGVPFDIIDVIAGKALVYFFGLGLQEEAKKGNSRAS